MSEKLWTAVELAQASGLTRRRVLQLLAEDEEIHGQQLSSKQWIVTDAEAKRWLKERSES